MEEHKETVESTESSSQTTDTNETQQSAQADLKMAADRAKSATVGFEFNKLFVGRIDHMNYLYAAVASIALSFTVGMIPLIGLVVSLLLCVLGVGLTIRRFHDIHITGWATLILIIPIVGLIAVIYLCWKKGDIATNPYGAVPDAKRDFFKAVLNT